jgi:DNA mismatch endonuclease (patch repair protein)
MSAIRSRDTQPELSVRRLLHAKGYRFVVARRVSGFRPDLLFTRRRKAIFVHGCFWHGHQICRHGRLPKTRTEYWGAKLEKNKARDERARRVLEETGWRVLTLWECEIREDALGSRLVDFLGPVRWTLHQDARPRPSARRQRLRESASPGI